MDTLAEARVSLGILAWFLQGLVDQSCRYETLLHSTGLGARGRAAWPMWNKDAINEFGHSA